MSRSTTSRFVILFALALAAGCLTPLQAATQAAAPPAAQPDAAAVLGALDRVVYVELGNASPREAFAELGRVGGIPIEMDPAARSDVRINAILKGVRLGDALSMLCRNCGLRVLPGNGRLVVAPLPVVMLATRAAPVRTPVVGDSNPWQGWSSLTGLSLAPSGETGYPRVSVVQALPGGGVVRADLACPNCKVPVQPSWAFCPHCGKQRLPTAAEGKFCVTCGRPNISLFTVPQSLPELTPPAPTVIPIRVQPK